MNPLAIHPGAAHLLLQIMLIGWAAIEVVLRLRNMGGRAAFDWTFCLVIAAVAAGVNPGFRGAHVHSAVLGGGLGASDCRAGRAGRGRGAADLGDPDPRPPVQVRRGHPG